MTFLEWRCTIFVSNALTDCNARLLIRIIQAHRLRKLNTQPISVSLPSSTCLNTLPSSQEKAQRTYQQPASQAEGGYCP